MIDFFRTIGRRVNRLFLVTVLIPTTLATLYYGLIASNVYISESRFIIYNPQTPTATSGLSTLLAGTGLSGNSYGVYAVQDYLLSRNALSSLQTSLDIEGMYTTPAIDWFDRFGGLLYLRKTAEDLYLYYKTKVSDGVDATSNISTLEVRAYTPRDAERINAELLQLAQRLVDRINARADADAVTFYETEVKQNEASVQNAAADLAEYRNQHEVFNPAPESALQLQLVSKLQDQLIQQQSRLAQMVLSTSGNPQIPMLRKAIQSTRNEITRQSAKVAGAPDSLASKSVAYGKLTLAQNFAETELAASITALEQARIRAQKQQLFIETVVTPNLPDEALEPKRLRGILAVFVAGLFLWGIFSVIVAGVKEHHDR
jgi:capsular polysaccharide transport system permease protein